MQPHRRQPTRLPHPWDSPGKNTEVGCHLLLQCMKVKSESEVAQLCPTLSNPMDCSLPVCLSIYIFTYLFGSSLLCSLFSSCGKQGLLSSDTQASHCPQTNSNCSPRTRRSPAKESRQSFLMLAEHQGQRSSGPPASTGPWGFSPRFGH